jgi:Cu+-exporting ATPase
MLTGDNIQTAKAIASEVSIDEIVAEVRPEEKSAKIKVLQDKGEKVGMVGDGINDAPALAQADVGLAIGTGTDVAIESGDVILASGSLKGVAKTIKLSRATMRTVRQNSARLSETTTSYPGGIGHGHEQHNGRIQQSSSLQGQNRLK